MQQLDLNSPKSNSAVLLAHTFKYFYLKLHIAAVTSPVSETLQKL